MWRLSRPLHASSSFSSSRRHVGREAVFLPWTARPWPSYETHADQWRFLDRTLSAVVGMTPAEVSAKSMRLCPRRLLHDIEDPLLVLRRRRLREKDAVRPGQGETQHMQQMQIRQQQQQQRRRRDGSQLPGGSRVRRNYSVQGDGNNGVKGEFVAASSTNTNTNTNTNTAATTTTSSSNNISNGSIAKNNNMRNSRCQRKKETMNTLLGRSPRGSAATTTTAAGVSVPLTTTNTTTTSSTPKNIAYTARSTSSGPISLGAVDKKVSVRQPRAETTGTVTGVGKGERKTTTNNNKNMVSKNESKMLASITVSLEASKNGEEGGKRVITRETCELRESTTTIEQPSLRRQKQTCDPVKGGKRRNKSAGSSSHTAEPTVSTTTTAADEDAIGVVRGKSPSG